MIDKDFLWSSQGAERLILKLIISLLIGVCISTSNLFAGFMSEPTGSPPSQLKDLALKENILSDLKALKGKIRSLLDSHSRELSMKDIHDAGYLNFMENEYFFKTGVEFLLQERHLESIRAFQMSALFNGFDFATAHNLGVAWSRKGVCDEPDQDDGDCDKALEYLSIALEMKPDHYPSFHLRAQVWVGRQEYFKALEDFSHAIVLAPEHHFLYLMRAGVWLKLGMVEKAIDDYSTAYSIVEDVQVMRIIQRLESIPESPH